MILLFNYVIPFTKLFYQIQNLENLFLLWIIEHLYIRLYYTEQEGFYTERGGYYNVKLFRHTPDLFLLF